MHVIALEAPREILEEDLVIDTAADVDDDGIVDKAAGIQVTNSGHSVNERPKAPDGGGIARPGDEVILRDATGSVETAGIEDQTDAREAGEGEGFERAVPSAIALFIDDVGELRVG